MSVESRMLTLSILSNDLRLANQSKEESALKDSMAQTVLNEPEIKFEDLALFLQHTVLIIGAIAEIRDRKGIGRVWFILKMIKTLVFCSEKAIEATEKTKNRKL